MRHWKSASQGLRAIVLAASAVAVSACGGGDGLVFGGDTNLIGDSDATVNVPVPSNLNTLLLIPSSNELLSDADNPALEGVAITVVALDASRKVISGVPITFSSNSGVIVTPTPGFDPVTGRQQSLPVTDGFGTVTATLTTGGNPSLRTIIVTASAGANRSVSVPIEVVSAAPPPVEEEDPNLEVAQMQLLAGSTVLASDASNALNGVSLTALVTNDAGNLVPGVTVNFSIPLNRGALEVRRNVTDSSGTATAILTTGGLSSPRTIPVTASVNDANGNLVASSQVTVIVVGRDVADFNVFTDRLQLLANATDTVTLTVIALDSLNNALAGVPVTFSSDSGVLLPISSAKIDQQVLTNSNGQASARLGTGGDFTFPRTITVTVTVGTEPNQVTKTITVDVVDPDAELDLPPVGAIELISAASQLLSTANSSDTGLAISAVVTSTGGNVIAGVPVQFEIVSGGGALEVTDAATGPSGTANAILTVGGNPSPRSITIRASVTGTSGVLTDEITIQVIEAVGVIDIFSARERLDTDDDLASEGTAIRALVRSPGGTPVSGVQVQFATTSGALTQAQGVTNANGEVNTVLSTGGDPTPRIITVSASTTGAQSAAIAIAVGEPVSSVRVTASSNQIPLDADTLELGVGITATVLDDKNLPLADVPIVFDIAAGPGIIVAGSGTTDENGIATATIATNSNTVLGSVIAVRVRSGGVTGSVNVTVVEPLNPDPVTAQAVRLITPSPTLRSDADNFADGLTLTAIVRGPNNNLLEGAQVNFTASSGAVQVTQGTTDAGGVATAVLTTAGNPTNRTIIVTATSGGQTDTITIAVVGTTLVINGATSIGRGDSVEYSARLTNGGGAGIPNESIFVSSTILDLDPVAAGIQAQIVPVTDAQGRVRFNAISQAASGTDTITASALGNTLSSTLSVDIADFTLAFTAPDPLGATSLRELRIESPVRAYDLAVVVSGACVPATCNGLTVQFSATRGLLGAPSDMTGLDLSNDSDADGLVDAFVVPVMDGVARTTITPRSTDGAGPIIVTATLLDNPATAGLIESGTATLNANFVATVPAFIDIQGEPDTVALNGTSNVRVTVRDTNNNVVKGQTIDFTLMDPTGGSLSATNAITDSVGQAFVTYSATAVSSQRDGVTVTGTIRGTSISASVPLTVSDDALRIILGTGNEIEEPTTTTYKMPFNVLVTDSSGNPAPPETVFTVSLEALSFQKGRYFFDAVGGFWFPIYAVPGEEVFSPGNFIRYGAGCPNEDLDQDGILDVIIDEDLDNDGNLDVCELDLEFGVGDGRLDTVAEDRDGDNRLDSNGEDRNRNGVLDVSEDVDGSCASVADCVPAPGEDSNGNGVLDPGEDTNGNNSLDLGEDLDGDGKLDCGEDLNCNGVWPETVSEIGLGFNVANSTNGFRCDGVLTGTTFSEDIDGDGSFDATEDLNGNGRFDSRTLLTDIAVQTGNPPFVLEDLDCDGNFDVGEDRNLNGSIEISEDLDFDGFFRPGTEDLDQDGRLDRGEDHIIQNNILDSGIAITLTDTGNGAGGVVPDGFISGTESFDFDCDNTIDVFDLVGTFGLAAGDSLTVLINEDRDGVDSDSGIMVGASWQSGDGLLDPNEDLSGGLVFKVPSTGEDVDCDGRFDTGEDTVAGAGQGQINNTLDPGEDKDNDGVLDVNEDLNNNRRMERYYEDLDLDGNFDTVNEDLDGDGWLDVPEDIDGDGLRDLTNAAGTACIALTEDTLTQVEADGSLTSLVRPNGRLDVAEDRNQNGVLDPGNVASVPVTVELDEFGAGFFDVVYAQQHANWVRVLLTATATVAGTETINRQTFILPVLANDVNTADVNPPGNPSPFGIRPTCFNDD